MITEENEYYLRVLWLLCEGCLYVTKKFLEQKLKKFNKELNAELKTYKGKLKHELHKKQFEKLFPNDGNDNTNMDTWDIQIVLVVTLRIFKTELHEKEKDAIKELKKYRNEHLAHSPTFNFNKNGCDAFHKDIQDNMRHLASECDSAVQKDCEKFIDGSLNDPLDIGLLSKYLQELAETNEKYQNIIDAIDMYDEKNKIRIESLSESFTKANKEMLQKMQELICHQRESEERETQTDISGVLGKFEEKTADLESAQCIEPRARGHSQTRDDQAKALQKGTKQFDNINSGLTKNISLKGVCVRDEEIKKCRLKISKYQKRLDELLEDERTNEHDTQITVGASSVAVRETRESNVETPSTLYTRHAENKNFPDNQQTPLVVAIDIGSSLTGYAFCKEKSGMRIYCLKCRTKTVTVALEITSLKSGRVCVTGSCGICGIKKSQIVG